MATTKTDALQRAIADLGAVKIAPEQYAWEGNDAQWSARWYVGNAAAILHDADAGVNAKTKSIKMPLWWNPEEREKWRIRIGKGAWSAWCLGPIPPMHDRVTVERITVDLETGQEVPA